MEVRRQVEESEGKRGDRMIEGGEEMREKKGSENRESSNNSCLATLNKQHQQSQRYLPGL